MPPRWPRLTLLLLVASLALPRWSPGAPASAASEGEAPSVEAVRVEVPPVLDGKLDDPAWKEAAQIGPLTQVDPVEGARPTQRTSVRIVYDKDSLYLGIRCFDSEPDKIVAKVMRRDLDMRSDDRVFIILDTFLNRRDAFFFEINPVGALADALIEGNSRFIREWNGIFYGKARIDDQGWTAELEIPFKTVSFDPSSDTWGFNFVRRIRRNNEDIRWSAATRDVFSINVSRIGTLRGLRGIEQGIGLDLKPSLTTIFDRNRGFESDTRTFDADRGPDNDFIGRPGGDLFYKFTPRLTGALTANTDFSEATVDDVQINLTRFSLFFPETRDFFLQDTSIFEFGGLQSENGLPFFSRRIGIVDGDEVRLLGGAKLTGRLGPLNIGALDVQMKRFGATRSKNLFVGRAALNVLSESSLGVIATRGDPATNRANTLIGADFRYRNSHFRTNRTLRGDFFAQRTYTPGQRGRSGSVGAKLEYPNDIVNWQLRYTELQENFNPALGFAIETGIRRYDARFRYRVRPHTWLRTVDSELSGFWVTQRHHDLDRAKLTWRALRFETNQTDILEIRYSVESQNLVEGFDLPAGVPELTIPTGRTTFQRIAARLESSRGRAIRGIVDVEVGQFFNGHRFDTVTALELRPSPHFFAALEFSQNDIRLPEGDVITRLARIRTQLNVNPDLSWESTLQYDNVTDEISLNSRIRWIVEQGNDVFLVFNQGQFFDTGSRSLVPTRTQLIAKVVYTFRF
ncbi:MAG: DUF5916 domain-containing protein [Myxococcota bacterium]